MTKEKPLSERKEWLGMTYYYQHRYVAEAVERLKEELCLGFTSTKNYCNKCKTCNEINKIMGEFNSPCVKSPSIEKVHEDTSKVKESMKELKPESKEDD